MQQSNVIALLGLSLAAVYLVGQRWVNGLESIRIEQGEAPLAIPALLGKLEGYDFDGYWEDRNGQINKTLPTLTSCEGPSRMHVSVENYDIYALPNFMAMQVNIDTQYCFQFRFSSANSPSSNLHLLVNIAKSDLRSEIAVEKKISIKPIDRPKVECLANLTIAIDSHKFAETSKLEDLGISFQMKSEDKSCNFDMAVKYKYDDYHNNKQVIKFLIFSFLIEIFDFVVIMMVIFQFERFEYICKTQSIIFWTSVAMFNCLFCFIHIYFSTDNIDKLSLFFVNAIFNFINFSLIILRVLHKIGKVQLTALSANHGALAQKKYIAIFYLKVYLVILLGLILGIQNFQSQFVIVLCASLFSIQLFSLALINRRLFPSMCAHFSLTASKLLFVFYYKMISQNTGKVDQSSLFFGLFILLGSGMVYCWQKSIGPRLFLSRLLNRGEIFDYFSASNRDLGSEDVCAICYSDLKSEVAVDWKAENAEFSQTVQEFVNHKKFALMWTPCGHFFHAPCLLTFMSYKMNCPICRTGLPELE